MKIIEVILLYVFLSSQLFAQSWKENLNSLSAEITNHPKIISGQWSLSVADCQSGEILYEINSYKTLAPASNMKLVISGIALDLLGEEARLNTFLEYSGLIDNSGTLQGNLYIRGEGDPTLGSSEIKGVPDLDSLNVIWIEAIKKAGIKMISGNIIADDSYLDYMPLAWNWYWSDMGNYYAAGTSGLCINENLYYLFFKPGKNVGDPAKVLRTEPDIPGLTFFNHMKTGKKGSGDNGYIFAAPWQYLQQLEGTIPADVPEFSIKGAIPDPALFAAQYLKLKLESKGIKISGEAKTVRDEEKAPESKKQIYITVSPPLKDIVFRLNKRSVNLYAEQLLKTLGKKLNDKGSAESGLKIIKNWIKKNDINTDGVFLQDGSGLSAANGTTTRFFVELLAAMSKKDIFNAYYNSLGIAGDPDDNGYMSNMCKGTTAAFNLRAKTGTIERVRAHSGYVHSRSGRLIAFSMIANNFDGASRLIDKFHEKVMIQLSELP